MTVTAARPNAARPDGALAGDPQHHRSGRVPVVLQGEVAECGLACLAMVLGHHGYETDIGQLRRRFPVSSRGMTLKSLIDVAAKSHLSGRPLKLDATAAGRLQLPCILHWDMNHFVVLVSARGERFVIHDPAHGVRKLSRADFEKHFTGVALELYPTRDFEPGGDRQRLRLGALWSRQSGLWQTLAQVLFLSLLLQIFAVASPFYLQTVVDDAILRGDRNLLLVLALGFGLLLLMEVGVSALRQTVILALASRLNMQLSINLFHHLVRLPLDFFEKRHVGDIASRFGSMDSIRELLSTGLVSAVVDGLLVLVTLVAMLVYAPWLTVIVLVAVALYSLLRLALYQPLHRLNEERLVTQARKDTSFLETLRSIQAIKLFQKENERQGQWQNRLADNINREIRIARLNIGYDTANRLLFGLENLLVIYFAAGEAMDNALSIGMIYAFMSFKRRFVSSVDGLIEGVVSYKLVGLHLQRLADIAFTEQEPYHAPKDEIASPGRLSGAIRVSGLTFRYARGETPVFEDLDLDIAPGEIVAITGPSGCGKTTLLKCLMGLLAPDSGTIEVDGHDIRTIDNYRRRIAAVMQDEQLFNGTIADNICCFDPQPDPDRIRECAQLACIDGDIAAMPMQYNTLVGDLGTGLSGGQKQRIAIARALYQRPAILFIDEGSSHLDVDREMQVNENLTDISATRVMVAHRSQTIALASRVINFR